MSKHNFLHLAGGAIIGMASYSITGVNAAKLKMLGQIPRNLMYFLRMLSGVKGLLEKAKVPDSTIVEWKVLYPGPRFETA